MVSVAVVQVRVDSDEQPADRVHRVADLVAGLPAALDLVVLPELWSVGAFDIPRALELAERVDGPFAAAMSRLARERGVVLHAGSFPERHSGGVSNTSLVFSATGAVVARYRKIHLFGFDEGEAAAVTPGADVVDVATPLGRSGLATCYDLRFPGLFRRLSLAGVRAYLVPSGWPAARIEHWRLLARARALENQAVLVGANAVGVTGGVSMGGRSVVVDASGAVLAEAGTDQEEVLVVDVDPDTVEHARWSFPVLADRRLD